MRAQEYHELRMLLEDMVRAWPCTQAHPALEAACTYLRTHCVSAAGA
jgi:hypothetical protein